LATPRTFSTLACAAPNVASASASDIPRDATSGLQTRGEGPGGLRS
jgi:hypothetical protein